MSGFFLAAVALMSFAALSKINKLNDKIRHLEVLVRRLTDTQAQMYLRLEGLEFNAGEVKEDAVDERLGKEPRASGRPDSAAAKDAAKSAASAAARKAAAGQTGSPSKDDASALGSLPGSTPGAVPPIAASQHANRQVTQPASGLARSIAAKSAPSIEQTLGTRWTIWLGAATLGLGAIFMVKHSIDQGYLTPIIRILFGTLWAMALLAAGEYMRRNDIRNELAGAVGAYIPGALAAAGITAAFATVYAAYAIYQFLDPLVAFVLLAGVSGAGLAYSMLHGPGLAAMGLVGSYVTPALVSTGHPRAWPLFIYLLFVTLASFVTAQTRHWLWLAVCALTGSVIWGFLWFLTQWQSGDVFAVGTYIAGLLGMALIFLKQMEPAPPQITAKIEAEPLFSSWTIADRPLLLGLGAIAVLATVLLRQDNYSLTSWAVFAIAIGVMLSSAWTWRSLTMASLVGASLFGIAFGTWHFGNIFYALGGADLGGVVDWTQSTSFNAPPALTKFLSFGFTFAGVFAALGFWGVQKRNGDPIWALAATVTPLMAFVYAYWRATAFEHSMPFGLFGVMLAGVAALAADQTDKTSGARRYEVSAGIFATAAVTALALALTILLEKGWLTIALAAITPLLALIARQRIMPVLRWLAVAIALIVMARVIYDPRIIGNDLGTIPVFNWLLYGYGLPAFAFALSASMFRKLADDGAAALLEAAAILFTALLIFLELRHFMNNGSIYQSYGLAEISLHSMVWLSLSLGYQWICERTGRWVPDVAATAFSILGLFSILFNHLLLLNPLLTDRSVGTGLVFNDLLLGYGLPAILCLGLYWRAAGNRHPVFVKVVGLTAFVLAFMWLSLEVRTIFQQGRLGMLQRTTDDAEWYTYSAVWLGYGLALLMAGIMLRVQTLRHAAMALVGLTIVKVFASDMSHLTGILRALSFIGLGLGLVAIGWLYQRLVFPHSVENEPLPEQPGDEKAPYPPNREN